MFGYIFRVPITTCFRLYTYAPRPGHGPETHRHRGARATHGASSSMFLLPASKSRWRVAILVWAVQETLLSRIVESEECIAFRSGPDGCHISVDRKKNLRKSPAKRHTTSGCDTPRLGVICCGSRRTVLILHTYFTYAHTSYIAICFMPDYAKKAWHSPAYRIPSAVGSHSAQ